VKKAKNPLIFRSVLISFGSILVLVLLITLFNQKQINLASLSKPSLQTSPKITLNQPQQNSNQSQVRLGHLSLTLPPNYKFIPRSDQSADIEQSGPDNSMSLHLYPGPCSAFPTPHDTGPSKTIMVARQYAMPIVKSNGRYGFRDQGGVACLGNEVLDMTRHVQDNENEAEMSFDQILETSSYQP
jgi:hypothetical protein